MNQSAQLTSYNLFHTIILRNQFHVTQYYSTSTLKFANCHECKKRKVFTPYATAVLLNFLIYEDGNDILH